MAFTGLRPHKAWGTMVGSHFSLDPPPTPGHTRWPLRRVATITPSVMMGKCFPSIEALLRWAIPFRMQWVPMWPRHFRAKDSRLLLTPSFCVASIRWMDPGGRGPARWAPASQLCVRLCVCVCVCVCMYHSFHVIWGGRVAFNFETRRRKQSTYRQHFDFTPVSNQHILW